MKNRILVGALVLGSTILGACAGGGYYVNSAPPPPRYGVIGRAPGYGYVWTDGYWNRRGNNWAWENGRWMRPPRRGAVWVRPEWRNEGGRYRFHRGRWR